MTTKNLVLTPFTAKQTPYVGVLMGIGLREFVNLDNCVRSYGDDEKKELGIRNSHELEGVLRQGALEYMIPVSLDQQVNGEAPRFRTINTEHLKYAGAIPAILDQNRIPFFSFRDDREGSLIQGTVSPSILIETKQDYVLLDVNRTRISHGSGDVTNASISELESLRQHSPEAIIASSMNESDPVRVQDIVRVAYVPIILNPEGKGKYFFPKIQSDVENTATNTPQA